ncbi:MAG: hypothetical protein BalsKO_17740 [Balneolaceae bacterium]
MMARSLTFLFIIFILFASACDKSEVIPKPEFLIPEDTYVKLMVELQLFDALVYTSEDSSYTDSLKEVLFNHYMISEEQFKESNTYYQSKPDEHIARIDSALKAIKTEQNRLSQADGENDLD